MYNEFIIFDVEEESQSHSSSYTINLILGSIITKLISNFSNGQNNNAPPQQPNPETNKKKKNVKIRKLTETKYT